MRKAIVSLLAFALVAGLYVYVGFATSIRDEPEKLGPPNAAENALASTSSSLTGSSAAKDRHTKLEEPPLIGSLRSREHTIYLYAGKFSVEDANGKMLARLIDQKQFSALLPDLFREFMQTYAEGEFIADNFTRERLSDPWIFTGRKQEAILSEP